MVKENARKSKIYTTNIDDIYKTRRKNDGKLNTGGDKPNDKKVHHVPIFDRRSGGYKTERLKDLNSKESIQKGHNKKRRKLTKIPDDFGCDTAFSSQEVNDDDEANDCSNVDNERGKDSQKMNDLQLSDISSVESSDDDDDNDDAGKEKREMKGKDTSHSGSETGSNSDDDPTDAELSSIKRSPIKTSIGNQEREDTIKQLEINQTTGTLLEEADELDTIMSKVIENRKTNKEDRRSILAMTSKEEQLEKYNLRKRYVDKYDIPPILYCEELIEGIQPYLSVVDEVLKGKLASIYYFEAREAFEHSSKPYLSIEEFRRLDLNKFLAGFYGFKRQFKVGEEILNVYKKSLERNKSATLRWWGIEDFSKYVLAPEVLASFQMSRMQAIKKNDSVERQEVYDLFDDTVEYGISVSDTDPLEKWEVSVEESRLIELGLDPKIYGSDYWHA
ncbi:Rtc4p NDAI_0F04070 [Naumovozyma dairenensis CBS 421]|uniref:Restriction of telomere capping protein 4 n=1 Tax=Naumovozyma dairenensis (strain ATCC 10597 / BCRC 20456 / CBS 421 / NBRC 0211 / NRRL Y-12639) TaxID=1071378 RepID=G0WD64_NAUDC|nr:hypothetical protein NDAI_0F04070 [Naumovozyma dairenensis CBS 421]CCD25725.1 hypothetical protein NDAI_0F04070 [Naumovozyma dairenensis CBS 421]